MISSLFRILLVMLLGSKNEPKYDLHPKREPVNLQSFNWTFIILALAMVLFFGAIWIFQIGNPYPNELMSNL